MRILELLNDGVQVVVEALPQRRIVAILQVKVIASGVLAVLLAYPEEDGWRCLVRLHLFTQEDNTSFLLRMRHKHGPPNAHDTEQMTMLQYPLTHIGEC